MFWFIVTLPIGGVGGGAAKGGARAAPGIISAIRGVFEGGGGASRFAAAGKGVSAAAKGADEAVGGVYSLRNKAGEVVRTGRTKDLAVRRGQHARDADLGQYRFQIEYRTDDYATQRGLEQLLHDEFGPPLNKIRPISPANPRLEEYLGAGREFRAR